MMLGVEKRLWRPALLMGVLAVFLSIPSAAVQAQSVKDLPPPPPLWKAKPTPTPTPPEKEVFEVIRTSSNLVMVPVSVTDREGQAVQGLLKTDFRLQEEGKQQEIAEIGDPEQVPLAIALLFDISSSVSQKGFFAFQQSAAATFLKQVMKSNDRAAVFTIASQPAMVQPLSTAEVAAAKIVTIPPATSSVATAFYDTVTAAAKYLESAPSQYRRVIIVITDGDDNNSKRIVTVSGAEATASNNGQLTGSRARAGMEARHRLAVADVQQAAQKADAIFYSVNPGGPSVRLNQIAMRAETGMEAIADATGGTAFIPDGEKDLERVFRQVAAELRGQYLLQYYANNEAPAGAFRRIQVSVPSRGDVRVRARQGYYPKKQQD
ncbi:MAG TPA: VWA domain-containing protein [Pyrinomonadaceae bacterium]|nr:VWA domain-containing protein [Pyrinomonadaceae bacterium]